MSGLCVKLRMLPNEGGAGVGAGVVIAAVAVTHKIINLQNC